MRIVFACAALVAFAPMAHAQTVGSLSETVPQAAPATHAVLKRKIAIGRFSNSTRYGKALLLDAERDPLADQAADMLTARLVDTGVFIVFERGDVAALKAEQASAPDAKMVGVDTLVVGSVTEFGRTVEGKAGFLNSKTRQVAAAAVEVRLVDVRTGQAFFSTTGRGTATVEAGEVAGFGGRAGYDSTLNDKAISAAVSDLMTNVIQKLQERRWFTDVLQVNGSQVMMSGGPSQGLRAGDVLSVEVKGRTVVSGQTGLPITLPGQPVARVEVISFFGESPQQEGAVGRVISGQIPTTDLGSLRIVEAR